MRPRTVFIIIIILANVVLAAWTYMQKSEASEVWTELETCESVSRKLNTEAWRLMDSVREASRKVKFIKRNGP